MNSYVRDWEIRPNSIPQNAPPMQQMNQMQMQQFQSRGNQIQQIQYIQNYPNQQPQNQQTAPIFNSTRTIQVTGFQRGTPAEDLKKIFSQFGNISSMNFQPQRGQLILSYYDICATSTAKNESRNIKLYDSNLFCDFIPDNEAICDSIYLQPKFLTKIVSIDSIKSHIMSYGAIWRCLPAINHGFIVQFYDCRIPSLVVSTGPLMIDSIVFTPSFSTNNPNDPLRDNSKLKIHNSLPELLSKEKAQQIVDFLKSKFQK